MKRSAKFGIFAVAALFVVTALQAQQPVTIALSAVGNPGNAADWTGQGSVGYTFNIGTYDVTLTQYTAFLNAVAQTDTYSLYNSALATDLNVAGIQQSGSSGNCTYSVLGDGQRPVTYVTWLDAARFCNWLNNGQPQTHVEDATTTENGAYTLNGDTTSGLETKNLLAQWYIPSENEWYKAAYYDPTLKSGTGGYWAYATRSNTQPGNVVGGGSNQANYKYWNGKYSTTQSSSYSSSQNYLTPVGSFTNSASSYGTYDQTGNVYNWTDAVSTPSRGFRGGDWYEDYHTLGSSSSGYFSGAVGQNAIVGFRVANLPAPEPTSVMLIGLGGVLLASRRRRLKNL